jgi:hypothetical protein
MAANGRNGPLFQVVSSGLKVRFREKQAFSFWLSKYRCRATGMHALAAIELE